MHKITEIKDVSRPRYKRFIAHIEVSPNINKFDVKTAIVEATKEIRNLKGIVHVVRLYVHNGKGIICQSMG